MTGPEEEAKEEKKEEAENPESKTTEADNLSVAEKKEEALREEKAESAEEKKKEAVEEEKAEPAEEKKEEAVEEEKAVSAEAKSEDLVEKAEPEAEKKEEAAKEKSSDENKKASSLTLTQHHVSHLLTDVLQDDAAVQPAKGKGIRFPMILDLLLGLGLLVAVGGFTVGLFHMYLVHSASQSISEQKYKAAIAILKGAPLPQVFSRPGSDTEELLSKARYLDAMEKLENSTSDAEVADAIKELGEISAGSKYFALAQEAINENTEPAPMMLQGGAETSEEALESAEQKQSLLEKALKEAPQR